jgi:hypothetical protein
VIAVSDYERRRYPLAHARALYPAGHPLHTLAGLPPATAPSEPRQLAGQHLYGELGLLAYDPFDDRIQCHACGRWFQKLTQCHLRKHGLTAWAYKETYGLNATTPLMTPRLVERHRALLLQAVEAGVMRKEPPPPHPRRPGTKHSAEYFRRHQSPEARAAAARQRQRWTEGAMLTALRALQQAHGGTLTLRQLRAFRAQHPDRAPADSTIIARFGSWQRVCALLGQPYRTTRRHPPPGTARRWPDAAILAALRDLQAELGSPLTARTLYRQRSGGKGRVGRVPSYKTVIDRFGSWERVTALLERDN